MSGSGSTLSPLAHRFFLALLLASISANIGNSIQSVGAAWLITASDGRADMISLVQTAISLPITLLALIGGTVADLYNRRRVMLLAQCSSVIVATLLTVLAATGNLTTWPLIALTFALGVNFAFYNPCSQASIGTTVPRNELPGAVSLHILGYNVARTIGPALGGGIVALGGAFAAFAANVLSCLAAIVVLFFWGPRAERSDRPAGPGIMAAMVEGLRCAWETHSLRMTMVRTFVFTLCGSSIWAIMSLVARDLTGGGPKQFGLLLGALGLGAMLGAAVSHEMRRHFTSETLVRTCSLIYGACLVAVAAGPGFVVTFIVLVIGGMVWVQGLSGLIVSCQMWAPRPLIGRVMATNSTMLFGGLALGSWIWGNVAEIAGLPASLVTSGLAMLIVAGVGLFIPLPRDEDAPTG